jgi:hypothetical protein
MKKFPMLQVGATGIEETAFILVLRIDSLTSSTKKLQILVERSSSELVKMMIETIIIRSSHLQN